MFRTILQLYKKSFSGLSREVWLLALVNLINRSGTMVIPFLTIYLKGELGFSILDAGYVMSFFGLGSLVGTFIGGNLTDRIGYYKVQFWSLFISGMAFISLQFLESFWSWCIVIFVTSSIADAFRPASMTAIAAYSKPENRTRSVSLIRLAINVGWAIGPAIAGLLAASVGYKYLFWGDGITCMAAAIFFMFTLSPKATKGKITVEADNSADPNLTVMQDRPYLFFVFLVALSGITFFQLFSTLPLFLQERIQLSEASIGTLLAINGFTIAIFEMPVVYGMESRFSLLKVVAIGTTLIGAGFLVLSFSTWIGMAVLCIILLTAGEILAMPFSNAFSLARSSASNRGRYMALYGMAYSTAFIGAPAIGTFMVDKFGWTALWIFVAGLSLLTTLGFYYLVKRLNKSKPVFHQVS